MVDNDIPADGPARRFRRRRHDSMIAGICSGAGSALGVDPTIVRVVLVTASADVIALTGEIQRVLRALGDPEPCVEVIPSELDPTPYHRAALAESVLVCTGADELVGHRGFSGANP